MQRAQIFPASTGRQGNRYIPEKLWHVRYGLNGSRMGCCFFTEQEAIRFCKDRGFQIERSTT